MVEVTLWQSPDQRLKRLETSHFYLLEYLPLKSNHSAVSSPNHTEKPHGGPTADSPNQAPCLQPAPTSSHGSDLFWKSSPAEPSRTPAPVMIWLQLSEIPWWEVLGLDNPQHHDTMRGCYFRLVVANGEGVEGRKWTGSFGISRCKLFYVCKTESLCCPCKSTLFQLNKFKKEKLLFEVGKIWSSLLCGNREEQTHCPVIRQQMP